LKSEVSSFGLQTKKKNSKNKINSSSLPPFIKTWRLGLPRRGERGGLGFIKKEAPLLPSLGFIKKKRGGGGKGAIKKTC
jgi:hypothetical protein